MKTLRAGGTGGSAAIAILLASVLHGQSKVADVGNLAFDVVSIKATKPGSVGGGFGGSGGRWTMINAPIGALIRTAYPSPTTELLGVPGWVASEPFDVEARASFSPTREQEQMLLRRLLADRFKFSAHYETRVRPVYHLMVARADGRLGPQLHHLDIDCAAYGRKESDLPPADPMPCSYSVKMRPDGAVTAESGGTTLQSLAQSISGSAGRPVFDQSGLQGYYGFRLVYGGSGPDELSVFTAIQEQLGLKLASARAPIDVLVVDHIEHPTEN